MYTPPQTMKLSEMGHPEFVGVRREHTPGAKARFIAYPERPKAEALGYLQTSEDKGAGRRVYLRAKAPCLSAPNAWAQAQAYPKARTTAKAKYRGPSLRSG